MTFAENSILLIALSKIRDSHPLHPGSTINRINAFPTTPEHLSVSKQEHFDQLTYRIAMSLSLVILREQTRDEVCPTVVNHGKS